MKVLICFLVASAGVLAYGQQQTPPPADPLNNLTFMKGDWVGKQDFNTSGVSMVGEATDRIETGIAGKYLCEMLSTTLPGRKPTDTRHFISFDKQTNKYTAWWFNDTSTHPMAFTGEVSGNKFVLLSDATGTGPVLRATYESPSDGTLTFLLEMKAGDNWNKLFLTTYTKKAAVAAK